MRPATRESFGGDHLAMARILVDGLCLFDRQENDAVIAERRLFWLEESNEAILLQQLGQGSSERVGNHFQIENRHVSLAAFDRADKCAVQVALFAEFILSESLREAAFANSVADSAEEALFCEIHT